MMAPRSAPEPVCDIEAQIDYMLAGHKDAVFIAAGNEDADPGEGNWARHQRAEGLLLTTSPAKLEKFRDADPLTDDLMAAILGYPCTKFSAILAGNFIFAQIRNRDGNIVKECVASVNDGSVTAFIDSAIIPDGGKLVLETPLMAQLRRATLRMAA